MTLGARLIRRVLAYPATWLVLATLAAVNFGFNRWFQPPLVVVGVAIGLSALSALLWLVLLTRSEAFAKFYYEASPAKREGDLAKLEALEADLQRLESTQGVQQLRMLREKLDTLTEVLKRRLDSGELTFGRYLGSAEQVYLAAIDNLHEIAIALTSVSTIDASYIDERLRELGGRATPAAEHEKETQSLEHRKSLLDDQLRRVSALFAQNETAMTVLANTATALADTKTARGQASMDPETAIAELERLAKRIDKYALSTTSGA